MDSMLSKLEPMLFNLILLITHLTIMFFWLKSFCRCLCFLDNQFNCYNHYCLDAICGCCFAQIDKLIMGNLLLC
uniref:Uncharacterized protein n=1 Tax=Helianthus annuus TaxID=4232 RepID=A0A251RPN5_HELAN